MKWLTDAGHMTCAHQGSVKMQAGQSLVRVIGNKVLVANDPVSKSISSCPNVGATIKPCTSTLKVKEGYSNFIKIVGRQVCLETIRGLTDGTPPGVVEYFVVNTGQNLVKESG